MWAELKRSWQALASATWNKGLPIQQEEYQRAIFRVAQGAGLGNVRG